MKTLYISDLDGTLLDSSADYICDTNDNDGVAKWLEENVL